MDRATIEPAIRSVLTEIHSKLNEAARIAKAAEACAGKYPPAKPGALGMGPLKAAGLVPKLHLCGHV